MRDRQLEVGELAKRQPAIGMHFAGLPTEAEVAEFGNKAREHFDVKSLRAISDELRVLWTGTYTPAGAAAGVQRPEERQR